MGAVPTSRVVKPRATYEDLLKVPENKVAEIVDGELYVSPRPAAPHALATSVLGVELGGPFHQGRGGPGGWWIVDEPELHLGEDVLVPDLAGWRRERMPEFPKTAFFTLAPDWVCETLAAPGYPRVRRPRPRRALRRDRAGPSSALGRNAAVAALRSVSSRSQVVAGPLSRRHAENGTLRP